MNTVNTALATLSMLVPIAGALPIEPTTVSVSVAEPTAPPKALTGAVVKSIDWENKMFRAQAEGKEEAQSVAWNDSTSFMLDGKKSTAKEVLIESGKVSVTFTELGEAARVTRVTR